MTKNADEIGRISAPLAYRAGGATDPIEIARALVSVWRDIDIALRPVLGQRGVIALFNRSVHLTAIFHPWLGSARQNSDVELDTSVLEPLFACQSGAQAVACGNRFLEGFHQLLVSLIGASLTERLLRPAWGPPSSNEPGQEPPR